MPAAPCDGWIGSSRTGDRSLPPGLHQEADLAPPLAAAAKVQLLLEPLNPIDFPGYVMGSVGLACEIIAAIGSNNIFLQYDLYHAQMSQGRLAQTFRDNFDRIRHVQIAGVPGRHEPDTKQGIDYSFLFSLMDELGYKGWVGCEYRPRTGTVDGLAWAAPSGSMPTDDSHPLAESTP